jgi:uncharacterized protein YjiK
MSVVRHRRYLKHSSLLLIASLCLAFLVHTPAAAVAAATAVHVRTIDTSKWNPPSPDPSGITYWPRRDHLIAVDGEVEEMDIWENANVFEATRAGSLVRTYDTTSFNTEPVGIDIEIGSNDHFFISNDSKKTIFDIDIGPDHEFGTSDDKRRPFLTSGFGNTDPEGLTLGAGKLYTVDGGGKRVYITETVNNGIFEASDPTTSFSVVGLGIRDPEGIDYDPRTGNLWIVDRGGAKLYEVTTSGNLVQVINLEALVGAENPADVTLAPASDNSGAQHLYIVERGIDNNVDPNENDGKIYEITFSNTPPPPPSGNLVQNPSFELANGGKPTVWSTNTIFTQSGDTAHGGGFSGKFTGTSESSATIKQTVLNLSAGTTYNYSAWVMIPDTGDTFVFKLQVRWRNSSNNTIRTDIVSDIRNDNGFNSWTQRTGSLTAPTGADNALVQLIVNKLSSTIYVDEVSFGA